MEIDLKEFVRNLVRNSLRVIKDSPQYRNFVPEELHLREKERLWENLKYRIATPITSFYGKQFPEIDKVFYGDMMAGGWVQAEEQLNERVTSADLDLLIIVSDTSIIPAINEITSKLDPYFLEFLRKDPFAAGRLGDNFLELHINDNYARQSEKDPGSCGASLVYKRMENG